MSLGPEQGYAIAQLRYEPAQQWGYAPAQRWGAHGYPPAQQWGYEPAQRWGAHGYAPAQQWGAQGYLPAQQLGKSQSLGYGPIASVRQRSFRAIPYSTSEPPRQLFKSQPVKSQSLGYGPIGKKVDECDDEIYKIYPTFKDAQYNFDEFIKCFDDIYNYFLSCNQSLKETLDDFEITNELKEDFKQHMQFMRQKYSEDLSDDKKIDWVHILKNYIKIQKILEDSLFKNGGSYELIENIPALRRSLRERLSKKEFGSINSHLWNDIISIQKLYQERSIKMLEKSKNSDGSNNKKHCEKIQAILNNGNQIFFRVEDFKRFFDPDNNYIWDNCTISHDDFIYELIDENKAKEIWHNLNERDFIDKDGNLIINLDRLNQEEAQIQKEDGDDEKMKYVFKILKEKVISNAQIKANVEQVLTEKNILIEQDTESKIVVGFREDEKSLTGYGRIISIGNNASEEFRRHIDTYVTIYSNFQLENDLYIKDPGRRAIKATQQFQNIIQGSNDKTQRNGETLKDVSLRIFRRAYSSNKVDREQDELFGLQNILYSTARDAQGYSLSLDRKEIALAAVRENVFVISTINLAWIEPEDAKEIALAAVCQNGATIEHIDLKIFTKEDAKEIVLAAVRQNNGAFNCVDLSVFNSEDAQEIASAAISDDQGTLSFDSRTRIALTAVRQNGNMIQLINLSEFNSKDKIKIALAAVRQNGLAIKYVNFSLFESNAKMKIAIAAAELDGSILNSINLSLFNLEDKKKIVLTAVTQNGTMLQFAPKELQNDKDVVLAAISSNETAFKYASLDLKRDVKFILKAIEIKPQIFKFICSDLKKDPKFLEACMVVNPNVFIHADEALKGDVLFQNKFMQYRKKMGLS